MSFEVDCGFRVGINVTNGIADQTAEQQGREYVEESDRTTATIDRCCLLVIYWSEKSLIGFDG